MREQSDRSNLVQGLINEIASSFVSLTPRNDEFWGILKFHIEILGSSPRMTQGRLGDDIVGNSRIPKDKFRIPKNKFRIPRDCFASLAMTRFGNSSFGNSKFRNFR